VTRWQKFVWWLVLRIELVLSPTAFQTSQTVRRVGGETLQAMQKTERSAAMVTHDGTTFRVYSLHDAHTEEGLDVLQDIEVRLHQARRELLELAGGESFRRESERQRLRGKAEGVGLALSYLREYK
jgi:hypothetical protein